MVVDASGMGMTLTASVLKGSEDVSVMLVNTCVLLFSFVLPNTSSNKSFDTD